MSKQQKRILAVMAVVMVLVLGGVVFIAYSNDYNRKMSDYQAELDGVKREYDLKATNIGINH